MGKLVVVDSTQVSLMATEALFPLRGCCEENF
jgi:hypothetical protein